MNIGGLVISVKNICKVTVKAMFKRLYLQFKCLLGFDLLSDKFLKEKDKFKKVNDGSLIYLKLIQ